jgi:hypothetical protein
MGMFDTIGSVGKLKITPSSDFVNRVNQGSGKSWASTAKTALTVAELSGLVDIPVASLEMFVDLGVVTTVWDTGVPITPAGVWALCRYASTLEMDAQGYFRLSSNAESIKYHHRTAMTEYLGIGFGLQIMRHVLAVRHPNRRVDFVDADLALSGYATRKNLQLRTVGSLRPDYFVAVDGGPVYVLECKGASPKTSRLMALEKAMHQLTSVCDNSGVNPPGFCTRIVFGNSDIKGEVIDPEGGDAWVDTAVDYREVELSKEESVPDGYASYYVTNVPRFRGELVRLTAASLLHWSGATGAALRIAPEGTAKFWRWTSNNLNYRVVPRDVGGVRFKGVEMEFSIADNMVRIFRGIDAVLYDGLMEYSSKRMLFGELNMSDRYDPGFRRYISSVNSDEVAVAMNANGAILRVERA